MGLRRAFTQQPKTGAFLFLVIFGAPVLFAAHLANLPSAVPQGAACPAVSVSAPLSTKPGAYRGCPTAQVQIPGSRVAVWKDSADADLMSGAPQRTRDIACVVERGASLRVFRESRAADLVMVRYGAAAGCMGWLPSAVVGNPRSRAEP